jgi:hypothetical protein
MARFASGFHLINNPCPHNLVDLFYEARYSHTRMVNPDFILLARSMGVHAIRCSHAGELPEKMKEFLEYDGSRPVLMECLVERNEHVFPMVRWPVCALSLLIALITCRWLRGKPSTSSSSTHR